MRREAENTEKLRELVLYVAERMGGDPTFGQIMLNKALFFSETLHYVAYGHSITGAAYYRRSLGPALHQMLPVSRSLIEAGDATLVETAFHGRQQKRLLAQRSAKVEQFTGDELRTIDGVIEMCRRFNATQISELSHQNVGWRLASDDEEIPFAAQLLHDGGVNDDDLRTSEWLLEQL